MEQHFNSDMKLNGKSDILKYGNAHITPLILLFIAIPTSAFKISFHFIRNLTDKRLRQDIRRNKTGRGQTA